jgi:hypothetical protein
VPPRLLPYRKLKRKCEVAGFAEAIQRSSFATVLVFAPMDVRRQAVTLSWFVGCTDWYFRSPSLIVHTREEHRGRAMPPRKEVVPITRDLPLIWNRGHTLTSRKWRRVVPVRAQTVEKGGLLRHGER